MDDKKILLVNLSKGRTGELNSKLLGMIFVMKFQAAAMSRAKIPESQRKDFCLYVDEFQNFSTDSAATIMSEARKYHLNMIVANQFTTQLSDEIRDAIFGNMGTIVSFRVGQQDVDTLSKYFQPLFDEEDLLRVPNFNAIVRTLINGVPTQSFSMLTLPPLGSPNEQLAAALKQLSAAKYGRPKSKVDKEIFARLATKEEPKPAFPPRAGAMPGSSPFGSAPYPASAGAGQLGAAPGLPPAAKPGMPGSGSSFLDEWLAKRRVSPPTPTVNPAGVMASTPAPSNQTQGTTGPLPVSGQTVAPQTVSTGVSPAEPPVTTTEPKKEAPEPLKTSGEFSIRGNAVDVDSEENTDTIYIDRDGNLTTKTAEDA